MDTNKHALLVAYGFGIPSLLGFVLQLGLGLWLATVILVGLACLVVGVLVGLRIGAIRASQGPGQGRRS